MNQLVVILIILRNYFKPFRSSAIKIFLCLIGLFLSFYIYNVYNSIQKQNIKIGVLEEGNDSIKLRMIDLILDYGDVKETRYSVLTDSLPITGTSIIFKSIYASSDNYLKDSSIIQHKSRVKEDNCYFNSEYIVSKLHSDNFDEKIRTKFDSAQHFLYFYALMDYQENNWLFPHPSDEFRVRKEKIKTPIITQSKVSANEISIRQFQELPKERFLLKENSSSAPFVFQRKKGVYLYEDICAETGGLVYVYHVITSPMRFYSPHFYSSYDVSKLELTVEFDLDTLSGFSMSFLNLTDIAELYPSPDIKNSKGLSYNDPKKLDYIVKNGLSIYIHFPKSESLQESRNYILSAIITLFLTLVATLVFNHFKVAYHRRKVYLKHVELAYKSHPYFSLLVIKHLILYDITICSIISVVLWICNPYDYTTFEKIAVTLGLVVFIPMLLYCNRLGRYRVDALKTENKRALKNLLICFAITTMLLLCSSVKSRAISCQEALAVMVGFGVGSLLSYIVYIIIQRKKKN